MKESGCLLSKIPTQSCALWYLLERLFLLDCHQVDAGIAWHRNLNKAKTPNPNSNSCLCICTSAWMKGPSLRQSALVLTSIVCEWVHWIEKGLCYSFPYHWSLRRHLFKIHKKNGILSSIFHSVQKKVILENTAGRDNEGGFKYWFHQFLGSKTLDPIALSSCCELRNACRNLSKERKEEAKCKLSFKN